MIVKKKKEIKKIIWIKNLILKLVFFYNYEYWYINKYMYYKN